MWTDVVDLRAFYRSQLGRLVRMLIERRLEAIWPACARQRVLGIGFATPFLNPYRAAAERVLAVMPAGQGVMRWPEEGANLVTLADGQTLPFPDRAMDRMILVHCLESSDQLRPLMRECWRVLADGGRMVVIVANRSGLWARAESSPFAQGRPYSMNQITQLLRDNLFVPLQSTTALFLPPFWWWLFRSWAAGFDDLGARWFPTFAGVLLVEVEKQIYAAPFEPARAAAKVAVRPISDGASS